MIERVTVVKFRVNYRGGNGAGCFDVFLALPQSVAAQAYIAKLVKATGVFCVVPICGLAAFPIR